MKTIIHIRQLNIFILKYSIIWKLYIKLKYNVLNSRDMRLNRPKVGTPEAERSKEKYFSKLLNALTNSYNYKDGNTQLKL